MLFDNTWSHAVAGTTALCALIISILHIIQHLRHYSEPIFQRYIVRIIFMIPVYSIASFLSLMSPANAIYYTTVRDCYEAWVIYNFLSLCLAYVGGPGAVEVKMAGYTLMPSWRAGTCCLPPMPVNGQFVRIVKQGALQFVLLKPVLAILTVVLYATGHYEEGDWSPSNSYLYLTIVYNVTYTVALYALLLFYMGTHELLRPFRPLLKFVLVKSVVFMTYWQGLLISILQGAGVVDSPEEGSNIQNWLLCVEMLPAAVFMLFAFPHTEYKVAGGELSGGNALHALSIRDLVSDTVHQFAPAYHNYVLYSDGATKPSSRTTKPAGQDMSKAADKDDLLESMELGGMPTWPGGGQGTPAPGGPKPGGSGQLGGLAGHLHSSELEVDSPPVLGKSKFLVKDDPFTSDEGPAEAPSGRSKRGGKANARRWDNVSLSSPK